MIDTNLFWTLRGTYNERIATLEAADPTVLCASIIDQQYNDFLRDHADFNEDEEDPHGHGKRLPYIGWFWRHLPFHSRRLPIGDTGGFVGFMANNKWGYPERDTTNEEFAAIMAIIDDAMRLNHQGGALSKIVNDTNAKLAELWDYLNTLTVG